MQLTKELLENEIKAVEGRFEQAKAQANTIAGALSTLKDMYAFLLKEEEKIVEAVKNAISPENAEIQARDEAALVAVSPAEPAAEVKPVTEESADASGQH